MSRADFEIAVAALNGRPQRLVTITRRDGVEFRDNINTDSSISRDRFVGAAIAKFGADRADFAWFEDAVVQAADAADADADAALGSADRDERKNQATQLIELASGADLFHDPAGDAFVRFPVAEHWEVSRLNNRVFRRWLSRLFYLSLGKTAAAQAMQDALGVLEAKAIFGGEQRSVHVRVAGRDGKIYIDLADEAWRVIEVTATGWQILSESPIMFRRAKAMLPLPTPVAGGCVDELRRFVHIGNEEWTLLVGWLLAALRPTGPFPVLNVQGEHGSGKSTVCRMARALVDPNTSPLRSEPRDARDLMIAANNGGVIALDNLSHVQPWFSDCLCRLSTGGGFSTRTLFENDEETVFDAQRPVIINGIDDVARRADLLDRCLHINLPRIDQSERRSEAAMWKEFNLAQPRILGGLLTAVSTALRNLSTTYLPSLPRMADFALWITAAEPALGWEPGRFTSAYAANLDAGNEMALESSPAGKSIIDFVEEVVEWSGTMTELLDELERRADQKTKSLKSWPKSSSALGTSVKRLAPNLRKAGISVQDDRVGKRRSRIVRLAHEPELRPETLSAPSAPSALSALSAVADLPAIIEPTADRADSEWSGADGSLSADEVEFTAENVLADGADRADGLLHHRSDDGATTSMSVGNTNSGRRTPTESSNRRQI